MAESTETRLARFGDKLDRIGDDVHEINDKLERNYITADQLNLRLAPFQTMKQVLTWIVVIVGAEIVGLGFFLIKNILDK